MKIRNILSGLVLLLLTAFVLFILEIGILYQVSYHYNMNARIYSHEVTGFVTIADEKGKTVVTLSKEGEKKLTECSAFLFVLNENGKIIYDYQVPGELIHDYLLTEVASFTRWYLSDYPVTTVIMGENLVIVGYPRNSMWKYQINQSLIYTQAITWIYPLLVLVNIVTIILVSVLRTRFLAGKKEQERTEWIAGVSHDIRTPLTIVLGNANSLKEKLPEGENAKKAEMIEREALHIRTLISNLNTSNKLAYGIGKWERQEVNLSALLRSEMIEMINRGLPEHYAVELEIDEMLENLIVKGDRMLIQRLLENLIDNAVVHNPQGCHIRVGLQLRQRIRPFTKKYLLYVADDGSGVSAQQLRKLSAGIQESKLAEHGLGTRLVKQIAKYHHWRIRFCANSPSGLICMIDL